jgi:class 3 adenylate cyclase
MFPCVHEPQTLLIADIADSTKLYADGDERAGSRLMQTCLDFMREAVRQAGGRVVDEKGDEILARFAEPASALRAASAMLSRLADAHACGEIDRPLTLRVGAEHGPLPPEGEPPTSATLIAAKRLADLATDGQILVTRALVDALPPLQRRLAVRYDQVVLKGLPGEREIYQVAWSSQGAAAPTFGIAQMPHGEIQSLELASRERSWRLDAACPRLKVGRGPSCDVRVLGEGVSRVHVLLTWNRGRVRLQDLSRNGTGVVVDGAAEVRVHRDTMRLRGAGRIRLGVEVHDAPLLDYRCTVRAPS